MVYVYILGWGSSPQRRTEILGSQHLLVQVAFSSICWLTHRTYKPTSTLHAHPNTLTAYRIHLNTVVYRIRRLSHGQVPALAHGHGTDITSPVREMTYTPPAVHRAKPNADSYRAGLRLTSFGEGHLQTPHHRLFSCLFNSLKNCKPQFCTAVSTFVSLRAGPGIALLCRISFVPMFDVRFKEITAFSASRDIPLSTTTNNWRVVLPLSLRTPHFFYYIYMYIYYFFFWKNAGITV